jgi:hypothetical protein
MRSRSWGCPLGARCAPGFARRATARLRRRDRHIHDDAIRTRGHRSDRTSVIDAAAQRSGIARCWASSTSIRSVRSRSSTAAARVSCCGSAPLRANSRADPRTDAAIQRRAESPGRPRALSAAGTFATCGGCRRGAGASRRARRQPSEREDRHWSIRHPRGAPDAARAGSLSRGAARTEGQLERRYLCPPASLAAAAAFLRNPS